MATSNCVQHPLWNRRRFLCAGLLLGGPALLLVSCSGHDRSEQPLPPHTLASGGPKPAEQAALDFAHADLSFRVKPDSRSIEGDAKLTFGVKAPIATLLLDLVHRERPDATLASFAFRAVRPTFGGNAFTLCGRPAEDGRSVELWAKDHEGYLTMQASATFA